MEIKYDIATTWNGDALHEATKRTHICLKPDDSAQYLLLEVDAFLYDDPRCPPVAAGLPCPGLWDYEVVEAFFLGSNEQYLEVELCPHGQHLVLILRGVRNCIKDQLPLDFTSEAKNSRWHGVAKIPLSYFPPDVSKFNAYAIHGSEPDRHYEALYPVPKEAFEQPDFHRLEYFQDIDIVALFPSWPRGKHI
jgi:hypothetical protein